MDGAPLIHAYDHARTAALQTYKGSLNAARESHEQAAGDFAQAATTTDDVEALRLLKLLEENHRELAKALANNTGASPGRTKNATSDTQDRNAGDSIQEKSIGDDAGQKETTDDTKSVSSTQNSGVKSTAGATLTSPVHRPPRRELASSIASNLATARGKPPQERDRTKQQRALPSTPEVTTQHAGGSIAGRKIPPSVMQPGSGRSKSPLRTGDITTAPSPTSDAFNSFYTSFETIFSKLPASLAFAGLPLTSNQPQAIPESENTQVRKSRTRHTTSARSTADPDLSSIFSAATLKAVREDAGQGFGAHESFYVVPGTRGGTAGKNHPKFQRAEGEEGEDGEGVGSDSEFVDARESLANSLGAGSGPSSPRSSKITSKKSTKKALPTLSSGGKTMEELELENGALKQLLDAQAKRLQMWEASAQSQSMALAQSLRLSRPRPSSSGPVQPGDAADMDKIRELEEQVNVERIQKESAEHRVEKLRRENERLLGVLGKYRDKWEMLKESARQREKRKEEERRAAAVGGTTP